MNDQDRPIRPPQATGVTVNPAQRREQAGANLPGAGIKLSRPDDILSQGDQIQDALNAHPELSALLFINPAAVLEDLGFELSPLVRHHVLETLGQGDAVGAEMKALYEEIQTALGPEGKKLNPANEVHTARILFDILKLTPLETKNAQVPRKPLPVPPRLQVLEKEARAPTRKLQPKTARAPHGITLSYPKYRAQVQVLDLEARLPQLPQAKERPERVSEDELIFYRDAHPLVPKLLRYQELHRTQLPFRSASVYREIRDGARGSVWRGWIQAVRYPDRGGT